MLPREQAGHRLRATQHHHRSQSSVPRPLASIACTVHGVHDEHEPQELARSDTAAGSLRRPVRSPRVHVAATIGALFVSVALALERLFWTRVRWPRRSRFRRPPLRASQTPHGAKRGGECDFSSWVFATALRRHGHRASDERSAPFAPRTVGARGQRLPSLSRTRVFARRVLPCWWPASSPWLRRTARPPVSDIADHPCLFFVV